jgi:hypothetical protein
MLHDLVLVSFNYMEMIESEIQFDILELVNDNGTVNNILGLLLHFSANEQSRNANGLDDLRKS